MASKCGVYTSYLQGIPYPKKNSDGVKYGDRGGIYVGPSQPIQLQIPKVLTYFTNDMENRLAAKDHVVQ